MWPPAAGSTRGGGRRGELPTEARPDLKTGPEWTQGWVTEDQGDHVVGADLLVEDPRPGTAGKVESRLRPRRRHRRDRGTGVDLEHRGHRWSEMRHGHVTAHRTG